MAHTICGYCGEPIHRTENRDTSDLDRGWDHIATPSDWGQRERRPTTWKHIGPAPSPDENLP